MTISNPSAGRRRLVAILTASVFVFGAVQTVALAKNHNKSDNHGNMNSGMKSSKSESKKQKSNDRSADKKHKSKDKEAKKGKDKDKTTEKDKPPVVISGGYVRDKLPNGTVYYRRATRDELDKAAKANGGGASAGNAPPPAAPAGDTEPVVRDHRPGAGTTAGNPPPAAPAGDGPVVRDHRPGATAANAGNLVPGTIIRDHRNGADGTPMIVVKDRTGATVTRKATEAELEKAGFKKPAPPATVEVPMGSRSGGL